MKKMITIFFGVFLALYVVAGYYMSGLILGGPYRNYDASQESAILIKAGLTDMPAPEALTIENNGITIAGSYYKNPNNANCAIILLHGRGGNRAETMKYVPLFWRLNCDVLAYDQRGYGNSSDTFRTYGYFDRKDATLAVGWLSEKSGLEPSQIGILGSSYGASVALQALAARSDLAFVIADSPFSSMSAIVTEHAARMFGDWVSFFVPGAFLISEIRADFDISVVSPEAIVATSHTPILLIHSVDDHTNAVENSERIFANSNQQTSVLQVIDWGPGHTNGIALNPEAFTKIVYGFIENLAPQYLEAGQ